MIRLVMVAALIIMTCGGFIFYSTTAAPPATSCASNLTVTADSGANLTVSASAFGGTFTCQ